MNPLSIMAAAAEASDGLALVTAQRSFTFAELAAEVAPQVRRLRETRRRPVALVARPDVESIVRLLALLEAGAPVLLLHPRWTEAERAHLLQRVGGALPATDTAAIVFTSGSTASPRGVQLSTGALVAAADASAANLGWRDDDRWLLCLPFAHVGGLSVVTRCLLARRAIALGVPDPTTLAATLAKTRATLLSLVPTTLAQVLGHGAPPPAHLRAVLVGGAAAAPALLARARAAGWPVLASYGLSETAAQVATQRTGNDAGCGPALPGIALRISPDQHIEIAGPTLFSGYFPGLPRAPGWYDSGDLGHLDDAGNLHVHGRADDVIITGGENVSPQDVEAALTAIPGVAAACVFAVPDATWGSLIAAAIVTTRPLPDVALAHALSVTLAAFKRPRLIARVAALAVLPSGKLDRSTTATAARAALTRLDYASVANAVASAGGGATR